MAVNRSKHPDLTVPWHRSLITRTILICAILILCLLGSIYIITNHYYKQVVREMRAQAESIAQNIETLLTARPEEDLEALEKEFETSNQNVELHELTPGIEQEVPMHVAVTVSPEGRLTKVAKMIIRHEGRLLELTVSVSLSPQTEILRAFSNQYLLAITAVFVVALGMMIYFIRKTLQPLYDLTETCAQITAGNLKQVEIKKNYGEVLELERTFNQMVQSLKEKEEIESRLRQAQRFSSLGSLAAGVAHDLRNPLNAIKLLSSHALDTLANGQAPEKTARQLKTIREEVNRLEEIVAGFLSLAKEQELKLEPYRVDDLLKECLRLVRKDAESRDIQLVAELRAGDTQLALDPKQWTRAILNVLINALEASPPGGRVRVFSRVRDNQCEVEIRDDGPGMSPETLEHAFDPYFTTKPTGTGLGLSVTRGIVEEHGGTIDLYSSEGKGCQVVITVPLRQEDHTVTGNV